MKEPVISSTTSYLYSYLVHLKNEKNSLNIPPVKSIKTKYIGHSAKQLSEEEQCKPFEDDKSGILTEIIESKVNNQTTRPKKLTKLKIKLHPIKNSSTFMTQTSNKSIVKKVSGEKKS